MIKLINPFSTNGPLLYSLKHRFSDVFIGSRGRTLVENGLIGFDSRNLSHK